ncbi:MAG: BrnT family toxin [Shimia sp.]
MRYEWDAEKRAANPAKHGLDFADVEERFDWDMAEFRDDHTRDEPRSQAIGHLGYGVVVIVFTMRGDACRIISMRRAMPAERRAYAAYRS